MTYREICQRIEPVFGYSESRAVVRLLAEERFGMTLADIMCGSLERLPAADAEWLEQAVARLERAEPVQYVIGKAWFHGNCFDVRPGVLIPRPETEWLVDRALGIVRGRPAGAPLRLLDIGTGSGCIAVSIALGAVDVPQQVYVEAWDVSAEALDIAAGNAARLSADVTFCRRDALALDRLAAEPWDIIVSNPPYICQRERADMARNVTGYEPSLALFVPDSDPLLFYRCIARYASRTLREGGRLLFECNTLYAGDVCRMLQREGFVSAVGADDCFGKPRFVDGSK